MVNIDPKLCALLLGSSPYHARRDFFAAEAAAFRTIFGAVNKVLFLPFALKDHGDYTLFNQKLFEKFGCGLEALSASGSKQEKQKAVAEAKAFFIGGGNTFRLLAALHEFGIFKTLHEKIGSGTPYLGTSAGATLFCPTIKTTNDMPIVDVSGLGAFNFLPFQINPHFPDSETTGAAETRGDRLREFHEENTMPVLALREGGFLMVKQGMLTLGGDKLAVLFRRDRPRVEIRNLEELAT